MYKPYMRYSVVRGTKSKCCFDMNPVVVFCISCRDMRYDVEFFKLSKLRYDVGNINI